MYSQYITLIFVSNNPQINYFPFMLILYHIFIYLYPVYAFSHKVLYLFIEYYILIYLSF